MQFNGAVRYLKVGRTPFKKREPCIEFTNDHGRREVLRLAFEVYEDGVEEGFCLVKFFKRNGRLSRVPDAVEVASLGGNYELLEILEPIPSVKGYRLEWTGTYSFSVAGTEYLRVGPQMQSFIQLNGVAAQIYDRMAGTFNPMEEFRGGRSGIDWAYADADGDLDDDGDGDGDGNGYWNGDGNGYWNGGGNGYWNGDGNGDGDNDGDGNEYVEQLQRQVIELTQQLAYRAREVAQLGAQHADSLAALRRQQECELVALREELQRATAARRPDPESATTERLRDLDRQLAAREAEVAQLTSEVAASSQERDSLLEALKQEHEAALAGLRAEHDRELAERVREHEAAVEDRARELERGLKVLQKERDEALERLVMLEQQVCCDGCCGCLPWLRRVLGRLRGKNQASVRPLP